MIPIQWFPVYYINHDWIYRSGKKLKHRYSMGYPMVWLSINGKKTNYKIHRLIALHFIPNPDNLPCVCHKDNNKDNYHPSNLYWWSYKDNSVQAYNDGLNHFRDNNPNPNKWKFWTANHSSKWVYQFSMEWKFLAYYWGSSEASRHTWVPVDWICRCCTWNRRAKSAWWFRWSRNKSPSGW